MLNNMKHAEAIVASGELEEQPSKFQALAAIGVKEYKVTSEVLRSLTGCRGEAGVAATSDLKASEYTEVKESIEARCVGVIAKPAPRRAKTQSKADDPVAKEMKETLTKRSTTLRQVKKIIDTYEGYVQDIKVKQLPKLVSKGFPLAMHQFYEEKLLDIDASTKSLKTAYAERVLKPETTDPSAMASVKEEIAMFQDLIADAQSKKQMFDKKHGNDLKKLIS